MLCFFLLERLIDKVWMRRIKSFISVELFARYRELKSRKTTKKLMAKSLKVPNPSHSACQRRLNSINALSFITTAPSFCPRTYVGSKQRVHTRPGYATTIFLVLFFRFEGPTINNKNDDLIYNFAEIA